MPKAKEVKEIKMKNITGESLYVNADPHVFRFSPGEELMVPAGNQKYFNTNYFKEITGDKE